MAWLAPLNPAIAENKAGANNFGLIGDENRPVRRDRRVSNFNVSFMVSPVVSDFSVIANLKALSQVYEFARVHVNKVDTRVFPSHFKYSTLA